MAFHSAIARAARNPLFSIIFDALRDVLIEQRRRTGTALPTGSSVEFPLSPAYLRAHLRKQRPGARDAMAEHLREAREAMLRYSVEMGEALPSVTVRKNPAERSP